MSETRRDIRLDATQSPDHVERDFTKTLAFDALLKLGIVDKKGAVIKSLPLYLRVNKVNDHEIDINYVFRVVAIGTYDITLTTWDKYSKTDTRLDRGGTNDRFWERNFYWATKTEYFRDTP